MDKPIEHYWQIRLSEVKEALEGNNFEVFLAASKEEARKIVLEEIIPKTGAKSCSWGGSMTITAAGVYEALKNRQDMKVVDTFDRSLPAEEVLERRRQSLMVDLFPLPLRREGGLRGQVPQHRRRHDVRINQRTATIDPGDGTTWRVGFALLRHVVDI